MHMLIKLYFPVLIQDISLFCADRRTVDWYGWKIDPKATLGYSDGTYYYTPDNWSDEIFENNVRQEYNLSVSGASDKMNYYMSAGYLDDQGIVPNSGFQRYSARLKADYQVKSWLKMGANVSFTHYDSVNRIQKVDLQMRTYSMLLILWERYIRCISVIRREI